MYLKRLKMLRVQWTLKDNLTVVTKLGIPKLSKLISNLGNEYMSGEIFMHFMNSLFRKVRINSNYQFSP
ncbi:uncharacterized protein PRCAT00006057001 [Priceomyces carsonii]|uniref:uncharacterized protein n=1 Tax=Priceomyces carsonii TaxID=28549 RepID=UPI002EDB9F65|nr:unnamed protein product [Priceomyces carsonii]